jgi:hypothetical protein
MENRIRKTEAKPTGIFGKPKVRHFPPMEFEIICYPSRMLTTPEEHDEILIFRQQIAIPGRDGGRSRREAMPREEINAGALTDAFLEVKSPVQALNFLNQGGRFRYGRDKSDWLESVLTWPEFQLWQQLVTIVLVENHLHLGEFESPTGEMFIWGPGDDGQGGIARMLPEEMKSLILNAAKPTFEWLRGVPPEVMYSTAPDPKDALKRSTLSAGVITETTIDAILASVFVDTLNAEFHLCAFPDCPNVFEVTSDHVREYCGHACAHKAGMRRRREEEKERRNKTVAQQARKYPRK